MDHPEDNGEVLFTADDSNGVMYAGDRLTHGSSGSYLVMQGDGNLVLYESDGTPIWASGTWGVSCARAELDDTRGLVVRDCYGTTHWSAISTPKSEHTNWHLEVDPNRFVVYDMDVGDRVYDSSVGEVDNFYFTYDQYRSLWQKQGFDHVWVWSNQDVQNFVDLFSHNSTDPHADAHRMLAAADAHNTNERALLEQWLADCDVMLPGDCAPYHTKAQLVENVDHEMKFIHQYVEIMQQLAEQMQNGSLEDNLHELVLDQVFSDAKNREILDFMNYALAPRSMDEDDRNRLLSVKGDTEFYDNARARMLGRHSELRNDVAVELNIDLGQMWNAVKQEAMPTEMLSVLEEMTLRVALSLPEYDKSDNTSTFEWRFKVGFFDGLVLDGSKNQLSWPVPRVLAGAVGGDAGLFANHEWILQKTYDLDTEQFTERRVLYSTGGGGVLDAFVTPSKIFDMWKTRNRYRYQSNDIQDFSTANVNEAGDLLDTELIGDLEDGDIELPTRNNRMSYAQMDSMIQGYDSATTDAQSIVDRVIDADTFVGSENTLSTISEASAFEEVPFGDLVEVGENGVEVTLSTSEGVVTLDGLASDEISAVTEAIEARDTASDGVARLVLRGEGGVKSVAKWGGSFLKAIALGIALKDAQGMFTTGGGFFVTYDWGQLSGLDKFAIFAAEFAGAAIGVGATELLLSKFCGVSTQCRTAFDAAGGLVGGLAGAGIVAKALGPNKARVEWGGFVGLIAKSPRWNLPGSIDVIGTDGNNFIKRLVNGSSFASNAAITFTSLRFTSKVTAGEAAVRRLTANEVTDGWETYNLPEFIGDPEAAVLLTRLQTYDGSHTAAARNDYTSAGQFRVFAEEETSGSKNETTHTTEEVGVFASREGSIRDIGGDIVGEAGKVDVHTQSSGDYHTINFDNSYTDPVIVLSIDTINGTQPAHMRVQSVGANSAQVQVEEWGYLDGYHANETVSYVVMEKGTHTLSGGVLVVVDTRTADTDFNYEFYGVDYDTDRTPVVMAQIQQDTTVPMVMRLSGVNNDYFWFKLEAEMDNESSAAGTTQEIGYIAYGEPTYPQPYSFVGAEQRSTGWSAPAPRASDGDPNGDFWDESVTHTSGTSDNWWEGDFGQSRSVDTVNIFNRTDCCGDRLSGFYILVTDQNLGVDGQTVDLNTALNGANEYTYVSQQVPTDAPYEWDTPAGTSGRYVMVYRPGSGHLSLAEVVAY